MGAQMQRRAYSRVCGASTAKRSAALGYAGAGPAQRATGAPSLVTRCIRRATGAPVMRRQDPQPELLCGLGAAEADEGVAGLRRDLGGAAA